MEDTRKHKKGVRRKVKSEKPASTRQAADEQAEIDALLAKKEANGAGRIRRSAAPEGRDATGFFLSFSPS